MMLSLSTLRNSTLWQRIFRTRAEDSLPHTITHQRVYIVPSKRGCAFILTLLLMLVASINYSLSLGYALCFLLTGLFAASLLHTYRNLAGLSISSITSHDIFAGEDANFQVKILNQFARTRHGIQISSASNSAQVQVLPNTHTQTTVSITTESRGRCYLGRLTIQSDWPLGLWTCWSYLHVAKQVIVFPQPEDNAPPLPADSGSDKSGPVYAATAGDVSGLRDYQPGDSIGSIAWKSAARGLGLQSRTFDNEETRASTNLDLRHATVPGLEAQLSRMCAWVLHAEQTQSDYTFRLPDFSLDKSHGKEQQAKALHALALFGDNRNKAA